MRLVPVLTVLMLPASAALAQEAAPFRPFSPLSGPNTVIDSPVCDLVNFGFCPQPPGPAAPFPDARDAASAAPVAPPPPRRHRHRAAHPFDQG